MLIGIIPSEMAYEPRGDQFGGRGGGPGGEVPDGQAPRVRGRSKLPSLNPIFLPDPSARSEPSCDTYEMRVWENFAHWALLSGMSDLLHHHGHLTLLLPSILRDKSIHSQWEHG